MSFKERKIPISSTAEYKAWHSMHARCKSTNHASFKNYGGRGIAISVEWEDLNVFLKDMGPRPSKRHSIDRIDNEKGYSKENCRWATLIEQKNNTRKNRKITYKGETKTVAQWAKVLNVSANLIHLRLLYGFSGAQLFKPSCRLTPNEIKEVKELAKDGVPW